MKVQILSETVVVILGAVGRNMLEVGDPKVGILTNTYWYKQDSKPGCGFHSGGVALQ
jgi:hypothetical protein